MEDLARLVTVIMAAYLIVPTVIGAVVGAFARRGAAARRGGGRWRGAAVGAGIGFAVGLMAFFAMARVW